MMLGRLLRVLPHPLFASLGCAIGWCLQHVIRFRRTVILTQMQWVFGHADGTRDTATLLRQHYRHLGLLLIEILQLPGISQRRIADRGTIHGLDNIERATAAGKGALLLTGHIGSWELGGAICAAAGYKLNAIGKEMKSGPGNVMIQLMRDDNGIHTITRRNSMKEILSTLKRNEAIIVMLDQNMTSKEGVFVDFFGMPACTMPALAVLAAKSEATILPVCTFRDPCDSRRHHLVVREPVSLESPHRRSMDNIIHNTSRFTKILESMILEHPEQWLWIHKRWKTRPRGETVPAIPY